MCLNVLQQPPPFSALEIKSIHSQTGIMEGSLPTFSPVPPPWLPVANLADAIYFLRSGALLTWDLCL